MDWSEWIAIYAAIVASFAFGWQIIIWWLGQARIEIQVFRATNAGIPNDKPKIFIKAINHGDKDITLHLFGLKHKDKGYLLYDETITKLEPRNCHTVFREEIFVSDALYPYVAFVRDATGKEYKSKPTIID